MLLPVKVQWSVCSTRFSLILSDKHGWIEAGSQLVFPTAFLPGCSQQVAQAAIPSKQSQSASQLCQLNWLLEHVTGCLGNKPKLNKANKLVVKNTGSYFSLQEFSSIAWWLSKAVRRSRSLWYFLWWKGLFRKKGAVAWLGRKWGGMRIQS